jgi:hypothetical protein
MNTAEIDFKLWRKLALTYGPKDHMDMVLRDKYGMQRVIQHGRETLFDFKILDEQKYLIFLLIWK